MTRALLSLAIALAATQVQARQITGPATVLDSTVIEINGQRIMLYGIDSVMRKQACTVDGKIWQCWPAAVRDLQTLVDQGPATCDVVGEPDPYGRVLGRCTINGQSLNEELVRRGYAVARPNEAPEYAAVEAEAKKEKRGLWQGQFLSPSDFRRRAGILVDRP
ncbi:MAG TPA: thermonuclease family protein [Acetobacteraceae bacterium]|jgi:endonuclease YncB( thermonuclease family)|nr:thermonuclease family protein [Acetobacteraceae bacterium]